MITRTWHLCDSDDARVDAAFQKTTEFDESLGIPTVSAAVKLLLLTGTSGKEAITAE
ncbi:MAG: hypothetical protein NW241_04945 [Bacteroidia bacterium]|nr:hypothetical protein [Bacteroidia bacterium]